MKKCWRIVLKELLKKGINLRRNIEIIKLIKGVLLDGVIIFILIEGALVMASAHDEKLLEYAFDKKIILTFPTSFLAIFQNLSMNIEQANLTRGIQETSNKAGELNNS